MREIKCPQLKEDGMARKTVATIDDQPVTERLSDGVLAGGICDGRVDDDEDRFDWDDRDDLDDDEYNG